MPASNATPGAAARRRRLAGDGRNGGGVALVKLFATILQSALDHGGVTAEAVTGEIANRYQSDRNILRMNYGQDEPWPAFTVDGIEQLADRGLLDASGDRWVIGATFVPGKPLTVIPAAAGRRPITVTVEPSAARHRRDELVTQRMNAASEVSKLRPDGPGLRPVTRSLVEELKQSMEDVGWLRSSYVLTANGGQWIIDGRHRKVAAAEIDGIDPLEIDIPATEEEALRLARSANVQRPWTAAEYQAWDRVYQDAGLTGLARENRWKWIRLLIESDPTRSARSIADEVGGVNHHTVQSVKDELLSVTGGPSSAHQSQTVVGRDGVQQVRQARRKAAAAPSPADVTAAFGPPKTPSPERAPDQVPARAPDQDPPAAGSRSPERAGPDRQPEPEPVPVPEPVKAEPVEETPIHRPAEHRCPTCGFLHEDQRAEP